MRPQDIEIGEYYRHKDSPTHYYYAQAIEILKPKQKENIHTYTIVKCKWMQKKNDQFCLIKYFRPCNLIKE